MKKNEPFSKTENKKNKDWVETFSFGNVEELYKLETGAQCSVLPRASYDKITTKPLQSSSQS